MSLVEYDHSLLLRVAVLSDPAMLAPLSAEVVGDGYARQFEAEAASAFYRLMPLLPERQRRHVLDSFSGASRRSSSAGGSIISNPLWAALGDLGDRLFVLRPEGFRMRRECIIPWVEFFGAKLSPVPLLAAVACNALRQAGLPENRLPALLAVGTVPPPDDPRIDQLAEEAGGLTDNHIHFSNLGSPVLVWTRALEDPAACVSGLFKNARSDKNLARLVQYMIPGMDAPKLNALFRLAAHIRAFVAEAIHLRSARIPRNVIPNPARSRRWDDQCSKVFSALRLLHQRGAVCRVFELDGVVGTPPGVHPGKLLPSGAAAGPVLCESLWWTYALDLMLQTADQRIARLLHIYHLIFHCFFRLVTQQYETRGFDLFEAFASNPVRDALESRYASTHANAHDASLLELDRSALLQHAELRIAPSEELARFLSSKLKPILLAYERLKPTKGTSRKQLHGRTRDQIRFTISIATHFIKAPDRDRSLGNRSAPLPERHSRLRWRLLNNMFCIRAARAMHAEIVAIDAANSEFSAGPEVFAPVFREFAHQEALSPGKSKLRFEFHVGEEFHHPLSGLRAIAEALQFLGLPDGSRIGHATALGLDFDEWISRVDAPMIPKLEWLDNLVWLSSQSVGDLRFRDFLHNEVSLRSEEIYGRPLDTHQLHRAWKLREIPVLRSELQCLRYYRFRQRELLLEVGLSSSDPSNPWQIHFEYRTSRKVHDRGSMVESIRMDHERRKVLGEALKLVARKLEGELARRRISIDALPTSNLRITQIQHVREHSIFRLMPIPPDPDAQRPVVGLCTDNPGMEQTSVALDLAALMHTLQLQNVPQPQIDDWARRLIRNGAALAFRP